MGQWAENAVARFFSEADDKRRSEELALIRHNKLQAGVEKTWKDLCRFIESETKDFNKRLGREFFTEVTTSEREIHVHAPQGKAFGVLDTRVPEIQVQHQLIPNLKPRDAEFALALRQGKDGDYILITDKAAGTGINVQSLGAQILNPLVA